MKKLWVLVLSLSAVPMMGQAAAPAGAAKADPFQALRFLQGTWAATAQGPNGVNSVGEYSFGPELKGHVFARHAVNTAACEGPADFDCNHGDLLYVYPEGPGLKAIFLDNEGHVIHYDVSTPDAATVVFLSEASQPPSQPSPQFRLTYHLQGGVMSGKFQMKPPGGSEWRSYLEWSGGKK